MKEGGSEIEEEYREKVLVDAASKIKRFRGEF